MSNRPANLPALDATRLQEIRSLLTYESSISFQSSRAHESMWMLFAAAQCGIEPIAAIQARITEVLLGHQMEWVEGAKTFDCSCNEDGSLDWMGTITDAVQHQITALLAAGVFRDEATVKAEAIRELAQVQRQLAADARTNNGQAEHEDLADWLDEQASAVDPAVLEGAHP